MDGNPDASDGILNDMAAYEDGFLFSHIDDETENGRVSFFYELRHDNTVTQFQETLEFPKPAITPDRALLDGLLSRLHVLLGISYWKTRVPKRLELAKSTLNRKEADFWNTVYTKGLGEFFYKNHIDYRHLVQFPFSDSPETGGESVLQGEQSLVLLGGGKDSVVTAELLKKSGFPFAFFALNAHPVQIAIAKEAGIQLVSMKRTIDPKLFAMNDISGVYNGHVPVSAMYALTGLLAAALYGYGSVIASNEESANYGNVSYLGSEINHQWSKSFEFETSLQKYYPQYFSLLRPMKEFRIVELFSQHSQYFSMFTSCNANFRHVASGVPLWCGACAKCAFVFLLLSAFLPKQQLVGIFGRNLYDDQSLTHVFEELLGLRDIKPFDCVGTPQEAQEAILRAHKGGSYASSPMVASLAVRCRPHPEVSALSSEHAIPKRFLASIKNL